MKKIKLAQIGIGHNHGAAKMSAIRNLPDYFEVVGVCEKDPYWYKERHEMAAYAGLPFMDEDELLRVKPVGGGGTSFYPVFEYVKEK